MKKIASFIAGVSLLAASLVPGTVSAAAATMTLAGATQSNGTFSTVVYENSDGPVSSVYLAMSFSQTVSGISYDYSVGPFTTTDPSGGHLSQGSVSGQQPVARVTFTLPNPGTVTASVDPATSYLKGASGTSVVRYAITSQTASFVYNAPAPAQGGMGGGSSTSNPAPATRTTTTTSGRNTTVAQGTSNTDTAAANTPATTDTTKTDVKGDATKDAKKDDTKKEIVQNTAAKKHSVWPWIILVIVAAAAVAYAMRNRATASDTTPAKQSDTKVVKPVSVAKPAATVAAVAGAKKAASAAQNKNANNKRNANNRSGKKNR